MSVNPVTWLVCRERWQAASFWIIAGFLILALVLALVLVALMIATTSLWTPWTSGATALTLILYLGVTSQACRFFVEARRNTVLELLLATPLSARRIIEGQWRAALRMFGPPVALFLVVYSIGSFIAHESSAGSNLRLSACAQRMRSWSSRI